MAVETRSEGQSRFGRGVRATCCSPNTGTALGSAAFGRMFAWVDEERDIREHFAYHTDVRPGFVLIGGVIALVIAQLTVSYHAIRAVRMNPVDAIQRD